MKTELHREIGVDSGDHFIVDFVDIFRKADTMSTMAESEAGGRAGGSLMNSSSKRVRLVLDEGKSVGAVARELDLAASALGPVGQARAGGSHARAAPV